MIPATLKLQSCVYKCWEKAIVRWHMLQYLVSFAVSVVASSGLTWVVRSLSRRYGLVRAPESSRHIHRIPIPRLGGLAVFGTFVSLYLIYAFASGHGWAHAPIHGEVPRILLLSTGLFLVGLADDLFGLAPWTKLLIEVVGAFGLYFSGIRFDFSLTHSGGAWTAAIGLGLTVFWVVLICNAINLIDGLDGLAAGAALFSMVTIFTLALGGRPGIATATTILAGSLFGFLIFNFNPASIFLGDSGSLFLGFMLSAFVLAESQKQATTLGSLIVPLVSFALPLTDVSVSLLRRFLSGHSIFGADREHIHHKLLELGLTQRQVVWVLYSVSALCAVLSLFLMTPSSIVFIPVVAIMLLTVFFGLRKLRYAEFDEFQRVGKRIVLQKRVFARNIAVRKAAATLETTRDLRSIPLVLESCLADDFDGLEIVLDDGFACNESLPLSWEGNVFRMHWSLSREKLVLALDLCAPNGRSIGQISLFQSAESPLLIDMDLLRTELRQSLAQALYHSVTGAHLAPVRLPALVERRQKPVAAGYFDRDLSN